MHRRQAALMRKRNAKGQPLMRFRVEGILGKLQAEAAAAHGGSAAAAAAAWKPGA